MAQIKADKRNFTKAHVKAFKNDFEQFKKFYDPRFKGLSASDVWKHIGGDPQKKEVKKNVDNK